MLTSAMPQMRLRSREQMILSTSRTLVLGALLLILGACTAPPEQQAPRPPRVAASVAAPAPPVAAKKPYQVTSPNGAREDEYYWLRDDTRTSKEVLAYLNAENAYRDEMMAHT